MDNARNYAKIFFSTLLNCIYLSTSQLAVMFICKKKKVLSCILCEHLLLYNVHEAAAFIAAVRPPPGHFPFHWVLPQSSSDLLSADIQQTCLYLWVCVCHLSAVANMKYYTTQDTFHWVHCLTDGGIFFICVCVCIYAVYTNSSDMTSYPKSGSHLWDQKINNTNCKCVLSKYWMGIAKLDTACSSVP